MLFGPGVVKEQDEPMTVADMVKETGTIQGIGRVGLYAKLLRVLAQDTVSSERREPEQHRLDRPAAGAAICT